MKKSYLYIVVILLSLSRSFAQDVFQANTMLSATLNNDKFSIKESASTIFYNELSKEIYLVIDFSKFESELDSTDDWLDDLEDTKLVYKASINSDNLLSLTPNNSKAIDLNGKIKFNGVVVSKSVEIILFEISKDGVLYRNNNNDYYDRIRTTIELSISPKDFLINKKPHHLTMPIFIRIENGYVNQFKPGMETSIGNNF